MTGAGEGRIVGSYRLAERIGRGGMGEVYRATHTKLGSERAVKVLPAHLAGEEDFLARFEREAASAARLDHPNVLPVYEYGESEGAPYLVMPYIKGGTLKERLAAGQLPHAELLSHLGQLALALDYAHQQGLVHRDVKPANMLLDGRGRLYLADFGIAKALAGAEGLTRTGTGVGTPEYMAPEQAQGRADARSDLYAMGVVLYQALTGQVPYGGNSTVEVLMKHLQDPLPIGPLRAADPALPPGAEAVVAKALAKDPNQRYQTGAALMADLTAALGEGGRLVVPAPGIAPVVGGIAATVVGMTNPAGNWPGQPTATQPNVGAPAWSAPPPTGVTPPPYGTGQGATVTSGPPMGSYGGTPPPQGGPPAYGAPPYGTPPPGSVPQYGGAPPYGTPPPGGMPPYGGPPPGPGGGGVSPRKSNTRGILFGILGGLAVLLLACIGGVAVLASRLGGSPTPTVQANVPGTATVAVVAANVNATLTASAPTATRPVASAVPLVAPSAAPTVAASTAPSAAPSAAPSVAPSAAPNPTASTVPLFPSTAPSTAPSVAPTARPSVAPSSAPVITATPRPSAAPSVPPTPRPSAAPSGGPTTGVPTGAAPAGWNTYSGNAKVPFAMFYPPGWTVDDSRASEGRVYFYGPGVDQPYDNGLWVLIATTGVRDPAGNIDVLRDRYYNEDIKKDHPEAGQDVTRNNTFSGITFASLGTTFNSKQELCYAYIGLGLNQQVPWRFRLNSVYSDYDGNLDDFFSKMISSMKISRNP